MAERRPAQIFVWVEGPTPDPAYVQQVLQAALPAPEGSGPAPAVHSAGVPDPWPSDLWGYALPRMRQVGDWTDPRRYALAGWTGTDSRSGRRIFVASIYDRTAEAPGPPPPEPPAAEAASTAMPAQAAVPAEPAEPEAAAPAEAATSQAESIAPGTAFPAAEAAAPESVPLAPDETGAAVDAASDPPVTEPPAAPEAEVAPPAGASEPAPAKAPAAPAATEAPTAPEGEPTALAVEVPAAPEAAALAPAINYGVPPGGFPPAAPPERSPWARPSAESAAQAVVAPPAVPPAVPTSAGAAATVVYPPAPGAPVPPRQAVTYGPPADAYPGRTGIPAAQVLDPYAGYYVGFGPRLVAGIVDLVLLALLEVALLLIAVLITRRLAQSVSDANALSLVLGCLTVGVALFIAVIYLSDFWTWRGQTPGQMMMGIRVVNAAGETPGFGQSLLRALGYLLALLPVGIGFLLILGDERKQGLHDHIAGTFVVPVHPGPVPRGAVPPGYPAAPVAAPTPGAAPPAPAYARYAVPAAAAVATYPVPAAPALPPPAAAPTSAGVAIPAAAAPSEEAASAFRQGLALLNEGVRAPGGNRMLLFVEPEAAQAATTAFRTAAEAAPGLALYRYFVGVARRYGEGFEPARPEFAQALRIDPGFWEAQMQLFFGPRWHDAFAYPAWASHDTTLPDVLRTLLPGRPGSRLVLVREGAARTVAVLSQTLRNSWAQPPNAEMPARLEVMPAPTPAGLIVALYVAVRDDPQNPYRGELFLNPAELPGPSDDATQLGQNLVLELARQGHTYLIFVDETGAVLLNRRLAFDAETRASLGRTAAQVQAVAYRAVEQQQAMSLAQFQDAARWHMQQFPLDRVRV